MPNEYDQFVVSDFCAPKGQFRIVREADSDSDLAIIGDFQKEVMAAKVAKFLSDQNEDFYGVYDEKGIDTRLPMDIPVSSYLGTIRRKTF